MRQNAKIMTIIVFVGFAVSIVAGCCGGTTEPASEEFSEPSPVLESISVIPDGVAIGSGKSLQYNAVGEYSDGTLVNITNSVTWSSSAIITAEVSAEGLVTANDCGVTEIMVVLDGVIGSATLTVPSPPMLQSISLSPSVSEMIPGQTLQFIAIATYSDDSTRDVTSEVVWSSSQPEVLDIGAVGSITAQNPGTAIITASFMQQNGKLKVTVINAAPTSTPSPTISIPDTTSELPTISDDTDSTMGFVKQMLSMMLENPYGMADMITSMLNPKTFPSMIRWLSQPGVLVELFKFVRQMIIPGF